MTTPLVSVVVPTYNSQATLRCALESIQRQDVLVKPNGIPRWPFEPLLRWRFQRNRRQMRATRGLPPPDSD